MTRITQQNLESYLWGAAVLLRGTIGAGDFKQFILPLLFYKRLCDVFDEETVTALRESGGDQDFALFPEPPPGPSPSGRGVAGGRGEGVGSAEKPSGRCAVLWPHGVLFRQEEADMRRKLIEADLIECVLGLGPNLFYNSPMEACVVVCRTQKPKARRGKILFINAVNEVTRERAQSFLTDEHLQRVVRAYQEFKDEPGFTRVVPIEEIRAKEGSLNITLYIGAETQAQTDAATVTATTALPNALAGWLESSSAVRRSLQALLSTGK